MVTYGDPTLNPTLQHHQHAHNQTLFGIDNQNNTLVGDVDYITDYATGGKDTLTGGNNSGSGNVFNSLSGDAYHDMTLFAKGGSDTLTGGDNSASGNLFNALYGDANDMFDSAPGGSDTLTGGN